VFRDGLVPCGWLVRHLKGEEIYLSRDSNPLPCAGMPQCSVTSALFHCMDKVRFTRSYTETAV